MMKTEAEYLQQGYDQWILADTDHLFAQFQNSWMLLTGTWSGTFDEMDVLLHKLSQAPNTKIVEFDKDDCITLANLPATSTNEHALFVANVLADSNRSTIEVETVSTASINMNDL